MRHGPGGTANAFMSVITILLLLVPRASCGATKPGVSLMRQTQFYLKGHSDRKLDAFQGYLCLVSCLGDMGSSGIEILGSIPLALRSWARNFTSLDLLSFAPLQHGVKKMPPAGFLMGKRLCQSQWGRWQGWGPQSQRRNADLG